MQYKKNTLLLSMPPNNFAITSLADVSSSLQTMRKGCYAAGDVNFSCNDIDNSTLKTLSTIIIFPDQLLTRLQFQ